MFVFINAIKKELRHHMFDYLLLLTFSVFFLILLGIFKGQHLYEFIILASYITMYFIWSLIHHAQTKTLKYQIVIEYILIAGTVLFILQVLLLG